MFIKNVVGPVVTVMLFGGEKEKASSDLGVNVAEFILLKIVLNREFKTGLYGSESGYWDVRLIKF